MANSKLLILGQALAEKFKTVYAKKTTKTQSLLRGAKELEEKIDSFDQTQKKLSNI